MADFLELDSLTFESSANGTNFFKGGMSLVGERGVELLNLPRGSQVIPNEALGGNQITINLDGATISSAQDAMQYAEQIGNSIIDQLAMSRRAYGV